MDLVRFFERKDTLFTGTITIRLHKSGNEAEAVCYRDD